MTFYEQIGVRPVINAATTLTVVGGSLMPDEVLAAMREAAGSFVDMHELHVAAGEHLARLTNNEAAYVTAGCAAALVLGTLGAITKGDLRAISRMPGADELPIEIIMHAAHRIPYDPALRLAGGHIVQIGNVQQTFDWELESALSERTAMVLWVAGSHLPPAALDLPTVVRIAHARGVPVLVDAAAQLPPHTNLWHFTRDLGADAAVFSGGKGLSGPQASGLMVGTRAFIEAARANGSPNQRLARALKAGKEEIAGLVRAVELYVARDHDAQHAHWEEIVCAWVDQLGHVPGLTATHDDLNEAGQPVPRVRVTVERRHDNDADQVRARLWAGDPRVLVLRGDGDSFFISPDTLATGEERVVVDRIISAASAAMA